MEEEEEEVKKKRRLEPSHQENGAQPVMAAAVESEEEKLKQEQERDFIVNAEQRFIVEKIQRLRRQIDSPITLKLPDKGEKIRRSLSICEQELQRRNQFPPIITMEAECENSPQSKSSSSAVPNYSQNEKPALPFSTDHGASNDLKSNAPSSQPHSQSKSTSWLFQMLGKKNGLPIPSIANYQITKPKGLLLNKDRREFKLPLRPSPFRHRFSGHDVGNLPRHLSRRGPSAAHLAEVLSSIHAMQQQFENMRSQLASFESNVTSRIDRLETKVEQIIQSQAGDKSTAASTS